MRSSLNCVKGTIEIFERDAIFSHFRSSGMSLKASRTHTHSSLLAHLLPCGQEEEEKGGGKRMVRSPIVFVDSTNGDEEGE